MNKPSWWYKLSYMFLYAGRDLMMGNLVFVLLSKYSKGNVLDVGGGDFFKTAKTRHISYSHWTTLEMSKPMHPIKDPRYTLVLGDGQSMKFRSNAFDTVINFHVLEHVLKPDKMVNEIARVLKPNGHAIFLVPSAATLHMAPNHYYNFTRFWIEKTFMQSQLRIVVLKPLGGLWSSISFRLFYFFLKVIRFPGMSTKYDKRNFFFYAFLPFMICTSIIFLPITLILSLGDLTEDPNNFIVVAKKQQKNNI